jgi:hypothetical protein
VSSFKMCDPCGMLFSTNLDGWAEDVMTIHRRYADGTRYQENVKTDTCPPCVERITSAMRQPRLPQTAIPATRESDDRGGTMVGGPTEEQ